MGGKVIVFQNMMSRKKTQNKKKMTIDDERICCLWKMCEDEMNKKSNFDTIIFYNIYI
jgi:hypothetical protein